MINNGVSSSRNVWLTFTAIDGTKLLFDFGNGFIIAPSPIDDDLLRLSLFSSSVDEIFFRTLRCLSKTPALNLDARVVRIIWLVDSGRAVIVVEDGGGAVDVEFVVNDEDDDVTRDDDTVGVLLARVGSDCVIPTVLSAVEDEFFDVFADDKFVDDIEEDGFGFDSTLDLDRVVIVLELQKNIITTIKKKKILI